MQARISHHDVPAHRRMAYFHDYVAASVGGMAFRPADPGDFRFEIADARLGGGLFLARTRYSATRARRDRRQIADGRDAWILSWHDADHEIETEDGTVVVHAGDVTVVDESRPYRLHLPAASIRLAALDRRKAERAAPRLRARAMHVLPLASPGTSLLAGYVDLIARAPVAGETASVGDHVYALLGLCFDAGPDGRAAGVGAARLALVKADMARRFDQPGLTLEDVARRRGVSARYVQQLFAAEGTSFSDHLRDLRCERARTLIDDPAQLARSIADIAFEAGFSDLSSFNRAFRRRFGMTPREMRALALARGRD